MADEERNASGTHYGPILGAAPISRRLEPPRYKRAVVIWVALYPAVVVALTLLQPLIGGWPIPLQALALTLLIIPVAVWILIPFVQGCLRNWLER